METLSGSAEPADSVAAIDGRMGLVEAQRNNDSSAANHGENESRQEGESTTRTLSNTESSDNSGYPPPGQISSAIPVTVQSGFDATFVNPPYNPSMFPAVICMWFFWYLTGSDLQKTRVEERVAVGIITVSLLWLFMELVTIPLLRTRRNYFVRLIAIFDFKGKPMRLFQEHMQSNTWKYRLFMFLFHYLPIIGVFILGFIWVCLSAKSQHLGALGYLIGAIGVFAALQGVVALIANEYISIYKVIYFQSSEIL